MKKVIISFFILIFSSCSGEKDNPVTVKEYDSKEITNMQYREGFGAGKKLNPEKPTYDPEDSSVQTEN